jgi:hypothetical protein
MAIRTVIVAWMLGAVSLLAPGCPGRVVIDPGGAEVVIKEVNAPANCQIQIRVSITQRGRPLVSTFVDISDPKVNTPGIDVNAPVTIRVEVTNVVGERCDPFYPPATWEFTGALTRESDGTFSAAFSQFRKTR